MERLNKLKIKEKEYLLPIFLPDATRAVVKSLDSNDLRNAGVEGVVVNTYHLMTEPGTSVLSEMGGIKKFMDFDGLITSDSGGWQIFSLIHRHKNVGKITDKGVTFSMGGAKRKLFTPEKSIQVQFDIDADMIICLDDFTPPTFDKDEMRAGIERTVLWAKRSKEEYFRQLEQRKIPENMRPMLLAVVQGGFDRESRRYCTEKLVEIGFDGYGFGGYVIDQEGGLDLDISEYLGKILQDNSIKFALGVGSPWEIVKCFEFGWNFFDCTLPTRDARHKRLYVFTQEPKNIEILKEPDAHDFVYIHREKYRRDEKPISKFCDCYTCQNFSRAYLNHLFNIEDFSAFRLATIHNLRTYTKLIQVLRESNK